jgi:hypothetical protein
LKLTAALHHHRQLADRHLFKNARRSTGLVGAVVVPFGLAFVVITIVVVVIAVIILIDLTIETSTIA